mgnify:CR=1 FL=1
MTEGISVGAANEERLQFVIDRYTDENGLAD